MGTLVTPAHFSEVRHSQHAAMVRSLEAIENADRDWQELTGRSAGGLLETYSQDDATIGVLVLGSIYGTFLETLEEYPETGPLRLIKLRSFRPFPSEALKAACADLTDLIVVERAFSPGSGGIVGTEVRAVLADMAEPPRLHNYAVGLGGRDIPLELLPRLAQAVRGAETPEPFRIFDINLELLPEEDR
jgi:pyruvate ferredoxin oxidoreductase alpha subunit